jgi:hypothetical protein
VTQSKELKVSSTHYTFRRASSGARNETIADLLNRITAGISNEERLQQVQSMARAMDDQFTVPGTNIRFGWDSILGVVPGLGDALTSAISLLIVRHAWQTGASPLLLARMLANIGVDFLLGSIPLVGDVADMAWKANRKNARLLERHLKRPLAA